MKLARRRTGLITRVSSQPAFDPFTSLSAAWPFSEASGQRRNAYQDVAHAADTGTVGTADGAANFVAADSDYLEVANVVAVSLGADTAFTWTIKFNADIINTGFLFAKGSPDAANANYEYAVFLAAGGNIGFRLGNSTTFVTVTTTSGSITAGTDHQVTVGHDPANNIISIKLDDEPLVTAVWAGGTRDGSNKLAFGRAGEFPGAYYDGRLWDAALWLDRYLTAEEQATLVGQSYPYGETDYQITVLDPDDASVGNQYSWHDFSDTTTLYQDTAKATPVAANDDPIRVAVNKFAGNDDLTAPSDTVRPLWKQAALNDLGVAEWDGVDTQLDHAEWPATDFTAFWVVKNVDANAGSHIGSGEIYLAVTGSSYDADPRAVAHVADNSSVGASVMNAGDFNIVELVRSGTSYTVLVNGQDAGTLTNASGFTLDTIGPFHVMGTTFDAWWFDGQLAERIRYSAALDARTRAQIRRGLAAKWGVEKVYYQPFVPV